jgi:hypothetical protein
MPILISHLLLFDPLLSSPVPAAPFCLVVTISVKMVSFRHVRYLPIPYVRNEKKNYVTQGPHCYVNYSHNFEMVAEYCANKKKELTC